MSDWPIHIDDDWEPMDEEELAPCAFDIDELNVTPGFKAWYENSGYGYIWLEPSFYDLDKYIVDDGLVFSNSLRQVVSLDQAFRFLNIAAYMSSVDGLPVRAALDGFTGVFEVSFYEVDDRYGYPAYKEEVRLENPELLDRLKFMAKRIVNRWLPGLVTEG